MPRIKGQQRLIFDFVDIKEDYKSVIKSLAAISGKETPSGRADLFAREILCEKYHCSEYIMKRALKYQY